MTGKINIGKDETVEDGIQPEWLIAALGQGAPREEFRIRCEEAAVAGLTMVKLKKKREAVMKNELEGEVLDRMVARLAALAKVTLDGVFSFYGIPGLDLRAGTKVLCQIASDLGLSKREARNAVGWMCLGPKALEFVRPARVAARGGGSALTLAQAEKALDETVRNGPPEVKARFLELDGSLREVYNP